MGERPAAGTRRFARCVLLLVAEVVPCCPGRRRCCPMQAGMTIVPVGVDAQGNINIAELKQKAEQHK